MGSGDRQFHRRSFRNLAYESQRLQEKPNKNVSTLFADDSIDYGDLTGYALKGAYSLSNYRPNAGILSSEAATDTFGSQIKQISKTGYENSYEDNNAHEVRLEGPNAITDTSKQKLDISLKDITEIALTALAFFSFGMFTLQVLMCIAMSNEEGSNLMMLPVEATDTSDINDGTEEIRRKKRSTHNQITSGRVREVSILLLRSIDHYEHQKYKNSTINLNSYCKLFSSDNPSHQRWIWILLYRLGDGWLTAQMASDYSSLLRNLSVLLRNC
ncbi:uncharacterized protein LOC117899540 [Drosophila subobscura]|uniref:uncharacterized protein LOC117899540 n=1 Tax=Drosophila subobscura TaxID=7241 RepID=UPI00155A9163|nr:uncharacterized protein LOC117899540 [Drosophila subobscura]